MMHTRAALRIISYLANPRTRKATIAARLCGVPIDIRGSAAGDLQRWLWDFDARPIADEERAALSDFERVGKVGSAAPRS
jgi:hypothetical protein